MRVRYSIRNEKLIVMSTQGSVLMAFGAHERELVIDILSGMRDISEDEDMVTELDNIINFLSQSGGLQ